MLGGKWRKTDAVIEPAKEDSETHELCDGMCARVGTLPYARISGHFFNYSDKTIRTNLFNLILRYKINRWKLMERMVNTVIIVIRWKL